MTDTSAGLPTIPWQRWLARVALWAPVAGPWQVGALDESPPVPGKDTTQIALTVIAGLGAAVALVVAYRRQRDAELARFDERFAAAAAQLGAGTAAERLAGV